MIEQSASTLIESSLRIMTWNVWWRYGPWRERFPAIQATIKAADPDIVALQEVWGDDNEDLATVLAAELGYHSTFKSQKSIDGIRFGNGLLSRWPIVAVSECPLPAVTGRDEQRLVVAAEVAAPRGNVQAFCTHLNWQAYDSAIRQAQVRTLAQFVADTGAADFVPIVCGDFNAMPESEEIRMLTGRTSCPVDGLVFRDAWGDFGDGHGYTWDNVNPHAAAELESTERIDYIYTGEPRDDDGAGHVTGVELAGNRPIDGVWPSDHFAVVADLRY